LKDGTLRIDKQAVREAEKYDGKYLIRTSDDTLSAEDVALGYKQLVDIEQAFCTLKSTLEYCGPCIIAWKTAFVRMCCSVGWLSCWFAS
jgi:hypothetical protein